MAITIGTEGTNLLVVRISGSLSDTELDDCQRALSKMIAEAGTAAALIVLEGFEGWARGGRWGDLSFLMEHDSDIEKIAIVGEEKWRDEVLVFAGAGLRSSPVRYFNELAQARSWLGGTTSPAAAQ